MTLAPPVISAPRFAAIYAFKTARGEQLLPPEALWNSDQRNTLQTLLGIQAFIDNAGQSPPDRLPPLLVFALGRQIWGLTGASSRTFLQAAHQRLCITLGLRPERTPTSTLEGILSRISHERPPMAEALQDALDSVLASETARPLNVTASGN